MKSLQVQAFLLCDRSSRDEATGKYDIFGIFDMIAVRSLPAVREKMEAYIRISCAPAAEVSMGFRIVAPSGGEIEAEIAPSCRASPTGIIEQAVGFEAFSLEEMGTHAVELLLDGGAVATYHFEVVESEKPADATLH